MPPRCQRLGQRDKGCFGAAERAAFGDRATERNTVIGHHNLGHYSAMRSLCRQARVVV